MDGNYPRISMIVVSRRNSPKNSTGSNSRIECKDILNPLILAILRVLTELIKWTTSIAWLLLKIKIQLFVPKSQRLFIST